MKKQFIVVGDLPSPWGASAHAVRAGNLILTSGQMSLDSAGSITGTDITAQARNAFETLKCILAKAGATMADVVKHNVYFDYDADDTAIAKFIENINEVRLSYFSDPGPTTTEIQAGLHREGSLILIDAWAIVGAERQRLLPGDHWNWNRQLPFSQGWKVGDMIFIGGQRSLDDHGQLVGTGDIEMQTENVFRNLDTMLREAGGNRNNLMRQNTFYRFFGQGRDVTNFWERMTNVRRRYMSVPSAAGAGLRILGLPLAGELIQVEGIGVLGENKTRLQPDNHWDWSIPNTQFTQGWRIGELAFIGGQISADNRARAVGKDMATQARNVFKFIRSTLREAGLDESDVIKLYIYYYAPGGWTEIRKTTATILEAQREFYPEPGPTLTAIRVSGFAFEDLLIEIEAIAVCRD